MIIKYYSTIEYQEIADMYVLGRVKKITQLHQGYGGSAKARVATTKGAFIVSKNILSTKKNGLYKTIDSLQYEIDMLRVVRGMSVPVYKTSKNKKYIENYKGGYVTVYDFIKGASPLAINTQKAYELGCFLGEFHSRSKKFKKEISTRRRFYDLNSAVMKKMKPVVQKQTNKQLKKILDEIENGVVDNIPPRTLPTGPIHVDVGHNNELFVKNKLTGIIDFGNFYRGPFMVDVGKTIMWNCCNNGVLQIKQYEQFMKGYSSKRKLNPQEISYIRKAILYAIYSHIWVDLYHVPLKYVKQAWPLYLIKTFLPVARSIKSTLYEKK